MSEQDFIKLMIRTQYRDEGDLTPPKSLSENARKLWAQEARVIELEELQSA